MDLYARFSDEMKETLPIDRLSLMRAQVRERFGERVEVAREESDRSGGYTAIMQWTRFDRTDDLVEVQWILRDDGLVGGFFVRPAGSTSVPSG